MFSIPIVIIFGLNAILYVKWFLQKRRETNEINEGILDEEKTEDELTEQNGV